MFKNLRKKKKGFTLIELIIVIAIIAILAAVAVPKFGDVRKNASLKADVANAKVIADATSALIAEGTIGVKVDSGTLGDTTTPAKEIGEYLQKIPAPQTTGYTKYKVGIDANGNVTVYMNKGIEGTDRALYPTLGEEPK